MKSEDKPITDDEFLLRRVHVTRFQPAKVPIISHGAFEPRYKAQVRDPDTDGISLYREACLADPTDILATVKEEKRTQTGIVRVPVAFLQSLGLTVAIKSGPPIKGHVVIPELNADAYKADQGRFMPILKAIAAESSKPENIVRRPESL